MIRQNQIVRIESKRHAVNAAICLQVFRTTPELAPLLAMIPGRPTRVKVKRAAWFAYEEGGRIIDFIAMQIDESCDWQQVDGRHLTITKA